MCKREYRSGYLVEIHDLGIFFYVYNKLCKHTIWIWILIKLLLFAIYCIMCKGKYRQGIHDLKISFDIYNKLCTRAIWIWIKLLLFVIYCILCFF